MTFTKKKLKKELQAVKFGQNLTNFDRTFILLKDDIYHILIPVTIYEYR